MAPQLLGGSLAPVPPPCAPEKRGAPEPPAFRRAFSLPMLKGSGALIPRICAEARLRPAIAQMRGGSLARCLGEPALRSGLPRRFATPQHGQDWALWSARARNAPLRGLPCPRTPAPRYARGYRLVGSASGLLASSPLPSAECARALSR